MALEIEPKHKMATADLRIMMVTLRGSGSESALISTLSVQTRLTLIPNQTENMKIMISSEKESSASTTKKNEFHVFWTNIAKGVIIFGAQKLFY